MYSNIYFRTSEVQEIRQIYLDSTKVIEHDAYNFFTSTKSLDELYSKVKSLENSERILDGFRLKQTNFNDNLGRIADEWVDPFTLSPITVHNIDFGGSEFIFFATIFIFFTLIFLAFTNYKKIRKFTIFVFLGLMMFNFINYFIVEPQIIADLRTNANINVFREREYRNLAYETFDSLYKLETPYKIKFEQRNQMYNYNVIGEDEYGNSFEGNVDADSEGGNGYINDYEGKRIEINVEWEGKGELKGYDNDGNIYRLNVN